MKRRGKGATWLSSPVLIAIAIIASTLFLCFLWTVSRSKKCIWEGFSSASASPSTSGGSRSLSSSQSPSVSRTPSSGGSTALTTKTCTTANTFLAQFIASVNAMFGPSESPNNGLVLSLTSPATPGNSSPSPVSITLMTPQEMAYALATKGIVDNTCALFPPKTNPKTKGEQLWNEFCSNDGLGLFEHSPYVALTGPGNTWSSITLNGLASVSQMSPLTYQTITSMQFPLMAVSSPGCFTVYLNVNKIDVTNFVIQNLDFPNLISQIGEPTCSPYPGGVSAIDVQYSCPLQLSMPNVKISFEVQFYGDVQSGYCGTTVDITTATYCPPAPCPCTVGGPGYCGPQDCLCFGAPCCNNCLEWNSCCGGPVCSPSYCNDCCQYPSLCGDSCCLTPVEYPTGMTMPCVHSTSSPCPEDVITQNCNASNKYVETVSATQALTLSFNTNSTSGTTVIENIQIIPNGTLNYTASNNVIGSLKNDTNPENLDPILAGINNAIVSAYNSVVATSENAINSAMSSLTQDYNDVTSVFDYPPVNAPQIPNVPVPSLEIPIQQVNQSIANAEKFLQSNINSMVDQALDKVNAKLGALVIPL